MSGISGFQPIDTSDFQTDADGPNSAGAETPVETEAPVVRGGVPITAQLVNMDSSVLQARLEASGMEETAAAETTETVQELSAEAQEMQAELDELYELESCYEELLADPELDPWTASWLESDLWDVRLEIYDLEFDLGKLEGDLNELVGNAWGSLLSSIGDTIQVLKIEGQKVADTGGHFDRQRDIQRQKKDIESRLEHDRERLMAVLREKGIVIPTPPQSEVAKKLVADLEKKLERAKEVRDDTTLKDLRDARKNLAAAGAQAGKAE